MDVQSTQCLKTKLSRFEEVRVLSTGEAGLEEMRLTTEAGVTPALQRYN